MEPFERALIGLPASKRKKCDLVNRRLVHIKSQEIPIIKERKVTTSSNNTSAGFAQMETPTCEI